MKNISSNAYQHTELLYTKNILYISTYSCTVNKHVELLALRKTMSRKVKEYGLEVRGQATRMLEAGTRHETVAKNLKVTLRTVKYWWATLKRTGSSSKRPRSGRRKIFGRIEKIVILKSVRKRYQSCRKLRNRLKYKILKDSKDTIRIYFQKDLGYKPFHRPKKTSAHKKEHLRQACYL